MSAAVHWPRQLVFVRHAIAVERDEFAGPDSERPLTDEGRARAKAVFRRAFARLAPTRLVTSPYERARETAALVQAALEDDVPEQVTAALVPDGDFAGWRAALADLSAPWRADDVVVVVGHEPSLGAIFAGHLGLARPVPFKKAGIGVLDLDDTGAATLVALLQPRFLKS